MKVVRGACHVIFVYDIAFSIDLNEAERRITSFTQRETIRHKRRAPRYFEYRPAPLRITREPEPFRIERLDADPQVELVVYDFGAISVIYRIALAHGAPDLLRLSRTLY